ncbi:YjbQ family protein [Caminibacter mediatlanticus TB-2]|uniref:YjbQ family protein n=1 Tax=Caminibacter mediatlanticus TB-2 TaxID=391592 RepID=A0ABX5V6X3_9BACT|nr:secondary thiamine-phosphate synthase enzyme YjbQ [Caminibacter mediatlanticus]QCT94018.1 YjbQ family protein [Caminibacter mediatlanticus TB-2]
MQKLKIKTNYKSEVVDITKEIKEAVIKSGVKSGIVTIFCPHTTANVILFENSDTTLKRDLLSMLKDIVPFKEYSHSNARAHLKASFLRSNLTLIIENADVVLGQWQGIYLIEFDGPRERNVLLKVISD